MNPIKLLLWLGGLCVLLIIALTGYGIYLVTSHRKEIGRYKIAPAMKGRWPKDVVETKIESNENAKQGHEGLAGDIDNPDRDKPAPIV